MTDCSPTAHPKPQPPNSNSTDNRVTIPLPIHPSLAFAPRKPAAAAGLSHAARSLGDARGERQPLDLSRGVTNRPRRRPATPSSSNTRHPTGCSSCNPRPVIRPFPPLTRPWLGGSFIYRGLTLDVMTLGLTSPELMTTTNRAGSGHGWSGHRVGLFFLLFFLHRAPMLRFSAGAAASTKSMDACPSPDKRSRQALAWRGFVRAVLRGQALALGSAGPMSGRPGGARSG